MRSDLVLALLAAGCGCELICVGGLLWLRDGFDQLHYSGAATTVGPVAFAVAVVLTGFSSLSGVVDCVLALALTATLTPVLTSATARVGRRIRFGTLEPRPDEFRAQP